MRSVAVVGAFLFLGIAMYSSVTAQKATPPRESSTPAVEEQSGSQGTRPLLKPGLEVVPGHIELVFGINGEAMTPTLNAGDFVLVDASAYQRSGPRRGDIIVFFRPGTDDADPPETHVKRIVALPGDRISFGGQRVLLNGMPLSEDYVEDASRCPPTNPDFFCDVIVPDGDVYVLGDHRTNSSDSRVFGPVPVDDIVGKAWFVYRDPTAHVLQPPIYGTSA